jgi:DNA-binding HxlR family transcriptional regulator
MTVPRKRWPECPIERFIAVTSGRWKAMVLWRLIPTPLRYTELRASIGSVSERALSQALGELAADGVIVKQHDNWRLTEFGLAMSPALRAMFAWGEQHKYGFGGE